jgi:hypothetical protein
MELPTPAEATQHTEYCLQRRMRLVAQGLDPDQGFFTMPPEYKPGDCLYCLEGKREATFVIGSKPTHTPTLADCRLARIAAEETILDALREFTGDHEADLTGGVVVDLIVRADLDGEPRRMADAVHIFATGKSALTRKAAEATQARIKAVLDDLCARTGLDLAAVHVFAPKPARAALCRPEAVRIDLAV